MRIVELIRKKRDGGQWTAEEIRALIDGYTDGDIPDYQMSAALMAVYFQSMDDQELGFWTDAMLKSGEVIDLSAIDGRCIDKHSTGGVGDKVSLVLAPLAVAAGLKVPMISGRGLGHTGGTLDKLESIPGFDVDQSVDEYKSLVRDAGAAMIGQTDDIAPADRELYALRDVTGTVECRPLIASSIMSKKLAEGIEGLVLDVKVGSGAFMKTHETARELGETMVAIGAQMNTPVRALMTDMNQPLGRTVGNSLEVKEAIDGLRGDGPDDLMEVTLELVTEMLIVAGEGDGSRGATRRRLESLIEDGEALEAFRRIVEAQDGDPAVCDDPSGVLPLDAEKTEFTAARDGVIGEMGTEQIGLASVELGAGRMTKEDEIDPAVGLVFNAKLGDEVTAGDTIAEVWYNDREGMESCLQRLDKAISVVDGPVASNDLIIDRIGG